jgi:glycerol kinase
MVDKSEKLIIAIDQGTSSSRVLLFSPTDWSVRFVHQKEFSSIYPQEGWSEQDPMILLNTVKEVINLQIQIKCSIIVIRPLAKSLQEHTRECKKSSLDTACINLSYSA